VLNTATSGTPIFEKFLFIKNCLFCCADRNVQVLFTMGHEIRQYRSWIKDYSDIVAAGRQADALDVDPVRQLMYWTDSIASAIYRAVVPRDEDAKAVAQALPVRFEFARRPAGLSVDWAAE
jgi:hypothetical protein